MPMDTALDDRAREMLRKARVAAAPRWYSPWLHLASSFGLAGALSVLASLTARDVTAWELATIPVVYLFCNALEWKAHKGLLHRRVPPLGMFYDRHTPVHHRVFVDHDMALRAPGEFGFILMPWYGSVAVFLVTLPLTIGLDFIAGRNVAALFVATSMAYILSYEVLHLAYHLPEDSLIGRLRVIRFLREHHRTHHRPVLSRGWNFNVTLPIWDVLMGTRWRATPAQVRRS
jgi:sterol desaturase/sphingolipid hydroxylase (fatty acid hydroxylase superfamily)